MTKIMHELDILKKIVLKDIIFNIKGFIVSTLFSIAAYTFIGFDNHPNYCISIYMSLMILFSNYIAKGCLLDERDFVYDYLKILPFKKSYIVLAKYIGSLLVIVVSCVTIFISNLILFIMQRPEIKISVNIAILMISIYLIYISLYLMIFFKYNYSTAQNTTVILFIGMIVVFKFFRNMTFIHYNIQYIVLIVSLMYIYFSYKISEYAFINKNINNNIFFKLVNFNK